MRTVLCYGDSNTWGYLAMSADRLDRWERWPGVLQHELGEDVHVVEEGLTGRTTMFEAPGQPGRSGLEFLPIALETHAPLDLVILALGVNDLFVPGVTARWAARGIETLVEAIRSSGAGIDGQPPAILVMAPPPVGPMPAEWEADAPRAREESRRLGDEFRTICEPLGVPVLDLAEVCQANPLDGVHFGQEEHHAIGLAVADRLHRLLA
jgi:lysophospholipase L1-like esterase